MQPDGMTPAVRSSAGFKPGGSGLPFWLFTSDHAHLWCSVSAGSLQVYVDKTMICSECNSAFNYTAEEQEFYSTVGFGEGPSRCPECRGAAADDGGGFAREYAESQEEQLFAGECVRCGATTRVPARMVFGDGTIYCSACIANGL
jgi:Probable zinc-ribbon domain